MDVLFHFPDSITRSVHQADIHSREVFADNADGEKLHAGKDCNRGRQKRKARDLGARNQKPD